MQNTKTLLHKIITTAMWVILVILPAGCNKTAITPTATATSTTSEIPPVAAENSTVTTAPSANFQTGCQLPVSSNFSDAGLSEGTPAINFTLKDVNGQTVNLADLWQDKPTVIVLGSFT